MSLTQRFLSPATSLTCAWTLPMLVVFCWPWVLGPSLTVVPFAVGLLAVALAGMVLRPAMPLAPLGWLGAVVGVAWLSGGGDNEAKAGLLAAAAACGVMLAIGRTARSQRSITQAFVTALLLAMVLHVAVAWLQFFDLERAFHPFANLNPTSRPYGNLRQSNHLASFALLGLLAVWWRHRRGLDERTVTAALAALAYSGVALSGSRTGLLATVAVSVGLLLLQRRSSRFEWCVFLAGPLWVAVVTFALPHLPTPGGLDPAAMMMRSNDSLSVRLTYWSEAWELALRHPLLGVGWSELGRARFEQLPPQAGLGNTVNAHNLVLHLLAEVGFAGAIVFLAPVGWLLWRQRPWRVVPASAAQATGSVADRIDLTWAWLLLTVVGLHSMAEYPLWYMPFLIPTAFAFGLLMAGPPDTHGRSLPGQAVAAAAGALLLCTVLALMDYAQVSTAYGPSGRSLEDPARALAVQKTVLFRRYADRALLERVPTTPENTPQMLAATARLLSAGPTTLLLWVRLSALCDTGQTSPARALASRLETLFPAAHAQFVKLKDPAALVRCGL